MTNKTMASMTDVVQQDQKVETFDKMR